MTLEEAKDILLKLEQLVSKTNRMYKKGERMDSAPFLKLHRKRISMFDVQEEAECIFIRFISPRICYLLHSKMVIPVSSNTKCTSPMNSSAHFVVMAS